MASILIYDEHCGWSPSLNASKGTGGAEVHNVQVATGLAKAGHVVSALCHDGRGQIEAGVWYAESRGGEVPAQCHDVLITVRASAIPPFVRAYRTFSIMHDDPRPEPERFAHLRDRSTLICVSEWQANLYRALGHTCVVLPAMYDDATLSRFTSHRRAGRYACVSAWNKGTDATLEAWARLADDRWHHAAYGGAPLALMVGSPYSAPDDAHERCERVGATWLGILTPEQIVWELGAAEAHVRINTASETFGMTDCLARALGCKLITLCEGDPGALEETTGSAPYTSRAEWERAVMNGWDRNHAVRDYRVSKWMPRWLDVLGLT